MVDTINPQTGKEEDFSGAKPETNGINNFYNGFGKADDVKVNLLDENHDQNNTGQTPPSIGSDINTAPVSPKASEANGNIGNVHHSYTANSNFNWKASLLIGLVGLISVVLFYFLGSLIAGGISKGELAKAEEQTKTLSRDFEDKKSSATPLALPVEETEEIKPPVTSTPNPEPPKVEEKPLETPVQPSSSYANGQG